MSLFATVEIPCPSCGVSVAFEAVNSVNAVGRPDLRDDIVSGDFQKQTCGSCGKEFRMDPQFTYIDAGRGHWFAVFPEPELEDWRTHEEEVVRLYDKAFGSGASPLARELGRSMRARLVFGWPALWEKLAVFDAGLDDVQIELLKIGLLRNLPDSPFALTNELRFVGAPDDGTSELAFAWVDSTTSDFVQGVRVPRALYDDIAAEPEAWQALRDDFADTLFVDMKRLVTAGA
ncbi:MAG: CpXC domain-containing protein [Planctomycetota bacterium]